MDLVFWTKIGLSFILGSVWVTFSTVLAERYGSKLGGLIAGMPSTIVISLLFIGLTQSPGIAAKAAAIIPLTMGINCIFMILFMSLVRRGLLLGLGSAIITWFLLAATIIELKIQAFWLSLLGWSIIGSMCLYYAEKILRIRSEEKKIVFYTPLQFASRAFFGGMIIAFAVFMGKAAGPQLGGIFATFPAVFTSTLIIAYRSGGSNLARAIAKSLMVSGMVTVTVYASIVRVTYPLVGLVYGTLAGILVSCTSALPVYWFIRKKLA